eukprot:365296-Chlamydomonas_euryale.AAC.17
MSGQQAAIPVFGSAAVGCGAPLGRPLSDTSHTKVDSQARCTVRRLWPSQRPLLAFLLPTTRLCDNKFPSPRWCVAGLALAQGATHERAHSQRLQGGEEACCSVGGPDIQVPVCNHGDVAFLLRWSGRHLGGHRPVEGAKGCTGKALSLSRWCFIRCKCLQADEAQCPRQEVNCMHAAYRFAHRAPRRTADVSYSVHRKGLCSWLVNCQPATSADSLQASYRLPGPGATETMLRKANESSPAEHRCARSSQSCASWPCVCGHA